MPDGTEDGLMNEERAILCQLSRYYHTLVDRDDRLIADRLDECGLVERKRQPRRGFPAMYRLRQEEGG